MFVVTEEDFIGGPPDANFHLVERFALHAVSTVYCRLPDRSQDEVQSPCIGAAQAWRLGSFAQGELSIWPHGALRFPCTAAVA